MGSDEKINKSKKETLLRKVSRDLSLFFFFSHGVKLINDDRR